MSAGVVRCVEGDVPAETLGVCYAHEHVLVTGGRVASGDPQFLLDDVEAARVELREARAAGLSALVDATPCSFGRDIVALAELSRVTGLHVVAATGLHLLSSYVLRHWSTEYRRDELEELFVADIEIGIDRHDYVGPLVHRERSRAGVIKIAADGATLSDAEARIVDAAAGASRRTGAPILAHTNGASSGKAIVQRLMAAGADPGGIVLSHLDRDPEPGPARALLDLGVWAELDQSPRDAARAARFVLGLLEAGHEDRLLLGMDMGRRSYWRAHGGGPGLAFLLTTFRHDLTNLGASEHQLRKVFVENPARAFALKGAA